MRPFVPGLLVGAVLGALAGGGGVVAWRPSRGDGPPEGGGQACGALLLDAHTQLIGYGAWYGFTVDRAGSLRVTVDLPAGLETHLLWGPPGGDATRAHLPDPALAERVAVRGPMAEPLVRRVKTLGPHVLLLEQAPATMGTGGGGMDMPVRVRVELVPDGSLPAR